MPARPASDEGIGGPAGADVPRPRSVQPVALSRLADGRGALIGPDLHVTGITASSDRVRPGDVFAALPGRTTHGAVHAPAAVAAGAVAVLTDAVGRAAVPSGLPVIEVPDVRTVLGPVAADVYGRPAEALTMLGVTGTSGKTTTTFLMRTALQAAGRRAGLVGTVATMIGDNEIKTGFTTPEAPDLQALLAVMRERGVTDVAMEVSSHALAMRRVDGIGFDVGAFTNLSEDHLDFHADMADYFAAKRRLFTGLAERAVVVVDDEWGRRLAAGLPGALTVATAPDVTAAAASATGPTGPTSVHGTSPTWRAVDIDERPDGSTRFRALHGVEALSMACAIPGRYNVANALLALAVLATTGVPPEPAVRAISTATVPGRMERIVTGQPFLAVVDYSHKPAAVDGALRALRPLTAGRLIVVLGCGGDRDRGKRRHMGELAARGADLLIVTDDNPRSEDAAAIRRAMLDGARAVPAAERGDVLEIGDRAEAVTAAVAAARAGDTVLVAGKGHETGQEIAGIVHPFDDRVVLRAALERR